jgi:CPA2 family monovalent cation:H+ antiporter-2
VRETFDSSVRAGRYVLENKGFSEYEAAKATQTFVRVDRAAMRDLAQLWVPGQPTHLNVPYVARARDLERDIATAMMEELHEVHPMQAEAETSPQPSEEDPPLMPDMQEDEDEKRPERDF